MSSYTRVSQRPAGGPSGLPPLTVPGAFCATRWTSSAHSQRVQRVPRPGTGRPWRTHGWARGVCATRQVRPLTSVQRLPGFHTLVPALVEAALLGPVAALVAPTRREQDEWTFRIEFRTKPGLRVNCRKTGRGEAGRWAPGRSSPCWRPKPYVAYLLSS